MNYLDYPLKYIRQTEYFMLDIMNIYRQSEVIMVTPDIQIIY
jgi:hypothetical protein